MKISKTSRLKAFEVILMLVGMILSLNLVADANYTVSLKYTLILVFLALGFSNVAKAVRLKQHNPFEFRRYLILSGLFILSPIIMVFLETISAVTVWLIVYALSILVSRIDILVVAIKKRRIKTIVFNSIIIAASIFIMVTSGSLSDEENLRVDLFAVALLIMLQTFIRLMGISMSQIRFDILRKIVIRSMAAEVMSGLIILIISFSLVLKAFEPAIETLGDALWYCFAIVTTIGFGDIAAGSMIGRILSVILGVYGLIVVALITSIIINFYSETKDIKMSGSIDDSDNNEPVTVPDEEPVTVTDEEARRERRRKLRDDLRRRLEKREAGKAASKKTVRVRKKETSDH
ncbi:Ion channel [Ruminococcaceae bacterium FB2012]|nr:Ion channel [Ruminococcaceae bacterium FB2012]